MYRQSQTFILAAVFCGLMSTGAIPAQELPSPAGSSSKLFQGSLPSAGDERIAFGRFQYPRPIRVAEARAVRQVAAAETMSCKDCLDAAIAAFKQEDDTTALAFVTRGRNQCPTDAAMLEFQALVMFARGDYADASAAIHKVLATQQGWNWATMHGLYPGVELYTKHLRALEKFTKRHPDDAAARFLQAYHYMVGGYPDAAVRELHMVIRLEYNDVVASDLLRRLAHPLVLPAPVGTSVRP